jgi:hypothetical protein
VPPDIHKNERSSVKHIRRATILLASATLLHGCGGKADAEEGHVRLVNATRDYSALDLYQSSTRIAKQRIFNAASSEVGSVDVHLRSSACSGLGSSDTALATNVTGLQDAYSGVGAASCHVCVTAAGDKSDLRLDIPALSLASQQISTLILINSAGGVLLNGLLNQQGGLSANANTSVRMRLAADAASSGVVSAIA